MEFLQAIFCYCSYTWAVQLTRGVFHFDISFSCWFRVKRVLFFSLGGGVSSVSTGMLKDQETRSGVFIAEDVDGVEEKGSGDTTTIDVQTLLVAFLENFQTWGLFSSAAEVSGFLEYQHLD
jgi:hypothetical protein